MTLTRQEARALLAKPKRANKYHAKRITVDGRTYDSQAEARYGEQLLLLERARKVGGVERQRPFHVLGPKGELVCTYNADFCFWDHEQDRFRVIDVKGVETPVFRLKRKLLRAFLGIDVELVSA